MGSHVSRAARLAAVWSLLAGCDFFRELDSAESATDGSAATGAEASAGTTGGTGTAGTQGCADADACLDQDRLRACDRQTGTVTEYDCTQECGAYLNFTCVIAGPGVHACWCVEPGPQKVYACYELEACLQGCGADPTDACANACFSRTTAETIRMFGALVHCAHEACDATCAADPVACGACLDQAMAGTLGDCALPRSVCDADTNDEPWP